MIYRYLFVKQKHPYLHQKRMPNAKVNKILNCNSLEYKIFHGLKLLYLEPHNNQK